MEALLNRKYSPGKPPVLSSEMEQEVRRMLEHSTPAEEGYGCESCWDTRILKHMLKEKFKITMSRSGIKDMLKLWGFSYTLQPIPLNMPVVKNKKRSNENGKW